MIALITRWTRKPNNDDVPPTKRATCGRAPVASMTRLKSSPPAKLAAAPHPSEYRVRAPGPSGSRLIGSESVKNPTHTRSVAADVALKQQTEASADDHRN